MRHNVLKENLHQNGYGFPMVIIPYPAHVSTTEELILLGEEYKTNGIGLHEEIILLGEECDTM